MTARPNRRAIKRHTIPIVVWQFHLARPELRALSTNGGDEDWLAIVPAGVEVPEWMCGGAFARSAVQVIPHPFLAGAVVVIGSHA